MGIIRGLKRLIKNLVYLGKHDLEHEISGQDLVYRSIRQSEKLMKANMIYQEDNSFRILDDAATWEKILTEPKSIVRIGDGELTLIEGRSIAFQKYDQRLAEYLKKILRGERTDLYIGIDYNYFHGYDNITEEIRRHNYLWGTEFKKTLVENCNPDREYISSSFNQLYIDYEIYDWDGYLENIRSLFKEREVVVFAGKGILSGLTYNVFDNARSCEFVWAPPENAFDEFDSLLKKAMSFSKNKVLCFILGPTSKPLVYELSREGFMAWDLGHMAKDYDCCCRKSRKSAADVERYFAPD